MYKYNCITQYSPFGGPRQLSRYSDSLQAGRSGDRIPVGWRDFPQPSRPAPGAHPAFCTMGTGYFQGVKRPGSGVDNPLPSSTEVEGRVELYIYSPYGLVITDWFTVRSLLSLTYVYCNSVQYLARTSYHKVHTL